MSLNMQKQTSRNLLLSANSQAAYGGVLADNKLTRAVSADPSTVFSAGNKRFSDIGAVGRGTDYASVDLLTAKTTMGTIKGMGGVDSWVLGYMLALLCGQDTITGTTPNYTHTFGLPMTSALAPCTTIYVEDTADVHRKYNDMSAKAISIDIPERGPIQATLEMVGTGNFVPGTYGTALPALSTPDYLLGSDMQMTFTPMGGGAALTGRQKGISFKMDRGTAPFESSGDGLVSGSNQFGPLKLGVDATIMALDTDDTVGTYEGMTSGALSIATNPAKAHQLILSFPLARIKMSKMGNEGNLVAWKLSFDETSMLQSGSTPAVAISIINGAAVAYLIPV